MFRTLLLAGATVAMSAGLAEAQSVSTSRTTTTTTVERQGDTTRTTTRSRTRGGGASIDTDAAVNALIGVLGGAARGGDDDGYGGASEALRRRAEPARAEDAFGRWVADDGGRDVQGCRFDFGQRGFMGIRSVSHSDCPSRLTRITNYSFQNGEMVLWQGPSAEWGRLIYVDGRFLGQGLTLHREDDTYDGPWAEDLYDDRQARDDRRYDDRRYDDRRRGGWSRASEADYAGTWRHVYQSAGMRRECTVTLTTNPAFGALGASQSGCFDGLMFTTTWRLEDGQVVLYKAGGGTVAVLRGRPDRLSGRTEDGAEVVLYR